MTSLLRADVQACCSSFCWAAKRVCGETSLRCETGRNALNNAFFMATELSHRTVGETVVYGSDCGRSRGGYGEAESFGGRVRKLAERVVEMADAGSLHSRRRVLTGG